MYTYIYIYIYIYMCVYIFIYEFHEINYLVESVKYEFEKNQKFAIISI